jgi:hypothetical protein
MREVLSKCRMPSEAFDLALSVILAVVALRLLALKSSLKLLAMTLAALRSWNGDAHMQLHAKAYVDATLAHHVTGHPLQHDLNGDALTPLEYGFGAVLPVQGVSAIIAGFELNDYADVQDLLADAVRASIQRGDAPTQHCLESVTSAKSWATCQTDSFTLGMVYALFSTHPWLRARLGDDTLLDAVLGVFVSSATLNPHVCITWIGGVAGRRTQLLNALQHKVSELADPSREKIVSALAEHPLGCK